MFKLVRFHGDDFYHICPQNEVRTHRGFSVKWENKFYAAEFLASSDNLSILQDLRKNLLKGYPKVELFRVKICVNPCGEIEKGNLFYFFIIIY